MRCTLYAALATLVAVVPAAAQGKKPTTKVATKATESAPARSFVAVLNGAYEVPPVNTPARGTVDLTFNGSQLHYQVHARSISDITGAYIHIGHAGDDQPAVADLLEGLRPGPASGLVASGTLRMADVHGTSMRNLLQALRNDDAYVTVHTREHPGGEIRGQLRVQPVLASK
jgi:CHRD domain